MIDYHSSLYHLTIWDLLSLCCGCRWRAAWAGFSVGGLTPARSPSVSRGTKRFFVLTKGTHTFSTRRGMDSDGFRFSGAVSHSLIVSINLRHSQFVFSIFITFCFRLPFSDFKQWISAFRDWSWSLLSWIYAFRSLTWDTRSLTRDGNFRQSLHAQTPTYFKSSPVHTMWKQLIHTKHRIISLFSVSLREQLVTILTRRIFGLMWHCSVGRWAFAFPSFLDFFFLSRSFWQRCHHWTHPV